MCAARFYGNGSRGAGFPTCQRTSIFLGRLGNLPHVVHASLEEEQIPDSLLRMIFVCCHPTLERKTQIALTLKTLCGFGISEIARGLLLPGETVKKRIQRAKNSLRAANVRLELPGGEELARRLDVVHDVLYLMFNEGYSTSHGTEPIRDDICEEAARLCHLLCESPCQSPATKALLALLLFHAARLDARTDWPTIVGLYTRLLQLRDSPIYALNRAIAVGQAGDTREAMSQLQSLRGRGEMKGYLLLDCAFARIHESEGDTEQAIDSYLIALSKATAPQAC